MRLYRGMRKAYTPSKVSTSKFRDGTDFSDCPAAAMCYAQGSRGVLLVLDVPAEAMEPGGGVTEELWGLDDDGPKRFMVWGRFDEWLVATYAAKDLRAQLRERGLRNASHDDKSVTLKHLVREDLRRRERQVRTAAG